MRKLKQVFLFLAFANQQPPAVKIPATFNPVGTETKKSVSVFGRLGPSADSKLVQNFGRTEMIFFRRSQKFFVL